MHDQRGPVPEPEVSDEVRPKQDAPTSDTENRVRVAVVDSHEPAAEPHVLESKCLHVFTTAVTSRFLFIVS